MSRLTVASEQLWNEQSMTTVNAELGPWIRMTAPPPWRELKLKDWSSRGPLFSSWVLGLGLVPLDRHTFGTLDLSPPLRFVERSSSWLNGHWRHERTVTTFAGGCEVRDAVCFTPRLRWLAPLLQVIYTRVFRHRHARLRARYAQVGTHVGSG